MSLFKKYENIKEKKSLVIYFSRKGENYAVGNIEVGNTEVITNYIKEITGADVFEVIPKNEYPKDYTKCTEVATEELKLNARPELKVYLEDISKYDVIYIGYPNWWGTMPMPMFTQLEKLDFSGKTIKPFCTHEGSMMGKSELDIKKICNGAILLDGLPIQGKTVNLARPKVEKWIG